MKNQKFEVQHINKSNPKSGVIAPLLANVTLNGMEKMLINKYKRRIKIIRYADDFVIMSSSLAIIEDAKIMIEKFLLKFDLEISPQSRIGHTMEPTKDNNGKIIKHPGLDFLGFHFRNIRTSIHRGVKSTRGIRKPLKQINTPSRESVTIHKQVIRNMLRKYKKAPRLAVIDKLAEIIKD